MARFTLAVCILAIFLVSCTDESRNLPDSSPGISNTRTYEVLGMNCPGCHGGLEKLVKKILTVQNAKADWVNKQLIVTIEPDTELNDEDIFDAITRANFTPGKRIN